MLPQLFLDRMKQMLEEEYPAFLNSYEDARYQAPVSYTHLRAHET